MWHLTLHLCPLSRKSHRNAQDGGPHCVANYQNRRSLSSGRFGVNSVSSPIRVQVHTVLAEIESKGEQYILSHWQCGFIKLRLVLVLDWQGLYFDWRIIWLLQRPGLEDLPNDEDLLVEQLKWHHRHQSYLVINLDVCIRHKQRFAVLSLAEREVSIQGTGGWALLIG